MRCRVTPCSGHHPFGFPYSSGEARDGQAGVTEVLEDVEGRISISGKTYNLGVAKSLEQGEEHGGREVGVWSLQGNRWLYAPVGQPKLPEVFHRQYRLWFAPGPP